MSLTDKQTHRMRLIAYILICPLLCIIGKKENMVESQRKFGVINFTDPKQFFTLTTSMLDLPINSIDVEIKIQH